jgi:hypothetical protein
MLGESQTHLTRREPSATDRLAVIPALFLTPVPSRPQQPGNQANGHDWNDFEPIERRARGSDGPRLRGRTRCLL